MDFFFLPMSALQEALAKYTHHWLASVATT
jgi:hypothetical protein